MEKLKPYTKKESNEIFRLWNSNASREEKQNYCDQIGRTYTQVAGKASYEKKMRLSGKVSKKVIDTPADLKVTVYEKPTPQKPAIISIGDVSIELPTRYMSINGVKIEW